MELEQDIGAKAELSMRDIFRRKKPEHKMLPMCPV